MLSAHLAQAPAEKDFYFGVEVVYGCLDELKAAVDETKTHYNLGIFVPKFTKKLTHLNIGRDYPTVTADIHNRYDKFVYWNGTIISP